MHLGNVFLGSYGLGQCSSQNGTLFFIIRLDIRAHNPQHTSLLLDDLQWLGLTWDKGPIKVSAQSPPVLSDLRQQGPVLAFVPADYCLQAPCK